MNDETEWKPWFAWYPIKLDRWYWLSMLERKSVGFGYYLRVPLGTARRMGK